MFEYTTNGTCSRKLRFELENGAIHSLSFEGGCDGNLKALGVLVEGMNAGDVVQKLKGLQCGNRGTSCADQLARAIAAAGERPE